MSSLSPNSRRFLLGVAIVAGSALTVYFATGGGRHAASAVSASARTPLALAVSDPKIPPPFETPLQSTTDASPPATAITPAPAPASAPVSKSSHHVAHRHRAEHKNVAFAKIRAFFRRLF